MEGAAVVKIRKQTRTVRALALSTNTNNKDFKRATMNKKRLPGKTNSNKKTTVG